MPERKVWTQEEDRALKYLKEERQIAKWSEISKVMEAQFNILGRNGKQCRERYHNHLDRNISNSEWTIEEENRLFELQDEVGNKWALISSKLPGRTDNCVKNHFYSKLRKSVRKINKKVHKHLKKEFKDIKTSSLYKMVQTMENRNKGTANYQYDTYQLCRKIINELRKYDDAVYNIQDQNEEINYLRSLLEDIALFDSDIKKNNKKINLKSSKSSNKIQEESVSNKTSSQVVSSTKSVFDEEESQDFSNSDLYSSSSLGQRSFYSNRSQRLLPPQKQTYRSHSIESESEKDSDENKEDDMILYKSARALKPLHKQWNPCSPRQPQRQLSMSLQLPKLAKPTPEVSKKENSLQKLSSGSEEQDQIYHWGQQSLSMRVISPQKLTIDEKIEINEQRDQLFCREMVMDIEGESLIKNFKELGISQIPVLNMAFQL